MGNSEGMRGQPFPFLLLERNQTNSKDGPTAHPGVLTSGPIVVLIALKLRAVPSKEAIRGT